MPLLHVLVLAIALALAGGTAASAAADSVTLTPADAPGFQAAGKGRGIALSALARRPSRTLRRASARGSALRSSGGRRIASGVFAFGSPAKARRALRGARRGLRKVDGVGDEGWGQAARTRKAATAVVLLRQGRGIGAVKVVLRGRSAPAARQLATAFAQLLAGRIERSLASTAFQRTLDGIRPDGSISAGTALRAFAIAYGPLPGVRRPRGGRLGVPESATLAMQLVARVWDQLTPAQRAAVDRRLGAPHDASSAPVGRAAGQVLTPSPAYQAIADKYSKFFAGKLGVPAPVIKVFRASEEITTSSGGLALADALPVNAAGAWGSGAPEYCRVRVPPHGRKEAGRPFFQLIMAHEVFHCFQFQLMTAWRKRTAWIIEGMADWAATSAYATTAAVGAGPYELYLQTASAPLMGRVYDATGFWHWADELHGVGSLWPKVRVILNTPDDTSAFVAAGGNDVPFQETWASAAWRMPAAGRAWKQTRPYAIPKSALTAPARIVTTDTSLDLEPFRLGIARIMRDSARPIVRLGSLSGRLRAGVDDRDFGVIESRYFCWGPCKCPAKTKGELPPHEKVSGSTLVAGLTGGASAGAAVVGYHGLDEFCREEDDPAREPSGPAESNGDPHLTSFDGLHFDFQAAGEFLLARSRSGDLEIQARQEPWERSRTVTINTQIALRVGGRRVTVSPGPAREPFPVVRIDGAVEPVAPGTSVPVGDGTVSRQDNSGRWITVMWADGSTLVVRPVGSYGVAIVVQLAGGRAGEVRGVLGDFDGNPSNDLANRAGKRIRYTAKATDGWRGARRFNVEEEFEPRFFDALYDQFGDAWRIGQAESLFDYAPGETTRTFTDRKVPTKPVDPDDLRRRRAAEAEAVCRAAGVTDPGPLDDCILDVAATGDEAFAADARHAQDAASVIWTQLAAGRDMVSDIRLVRAPDGLLHVAFTRDGAGARQAVSVPIDPAGRQGPLETIKDADADAGLFVGPDGGLRAVTAELPFDAPSGVYQYARSPSGAWSPLGRVTNYGSSYVSRPSALALPGGGLLTVSPMAGVARLFAGAPASPPEGAEFPVAEGCYGSSPAIARDAATGAVWVAWYQWDCPVVGVFAAQVDPATGTFAAPPVQAPGSVWEGESGADSPDLDLTEDLALTGRPGQAGVWLAYESGRRGDVALWQVGTPAAQTVPRRKTAARHVRLAAEPGSGRLWVVWSESGRIWVQRTNPDGTRDGAPRPVNPPNDTGDSLGLADLQVDAGAGGLELLYGRRRGDAPGGLYRAKLVP